MLSNKIHTAVKVGFAVLLAVGFLISGQQLLKRYINKKLSEDSNVRSGIPFLVSTGERNIRILPFSLIVKDLEIKSITGHTSPENDSTQETTHYQIYCKELSVRGIRLLAFLMDKKMNAKSIVFDQPEVKISGRKWLSGSTEKDYEQILNDLRPLAMSWFSQFNIKRIALNDANFRIFGSLSDTSQIAGANRISVEILNFLSHNPGLQKPASWFTTDDILVKITHFHHVMGDTLHVLEIDSLTWSRRNSGIHASGFYLHPVGSTTVKNLYDVRVPRLFIRSRNLAGLTLRDSVNIEYLGFYQPEIRFYRDHISKKIDPDNINNFNLYSLIEKEFTRISIDSFRLVNASLEIYRFPEKYEFQQKFKSIDVTLNGFALDSTSFRNRDKLLHADNLEMTVSGYQLHLDDNAHDFSADSLFISTFNNSVGIRKIRIFPVQNDSSFTRARVNISCEAAEIEQVDLKALYHTRSLPAKKIKIEHPLVDLKYHQQFKKSKAQGEAGLLFEWVSDYLKGVYADTVTVNQGFLSIDNLNNNKLLGYFDTGFTFGLQGFSLDSASISNTESFFYAKNFHLRFHDYQMQLTDDLHRIKVDQVTVGSEQQKLEIENLSLEPKYLEVNDSILNHFNRSELYHIKVPRILLSGVDLRKAFFYNQLKIKYFRITEPDIHLENFGHLRDTLHKKELDDLYALIFNYISDISVDKAEIPSGALTWINHTRRGKTITFDNAFSASLENFRLNPSETGKNRLLFSDNFDISLKNQIFQLSDSVHILKAGQISLSTKNASVILEDALLYPLITAPKYSRLSTTFQISIPRLKISNIDYQRAYYSKELVLDQLDISKAGFRVYSKQGEIKSLDLSRFKVPFPAFISFLKVADFRIRQSECILYENENLNYIPKSNFTLDLEIPGMVIRRNTDHQAKIESDNISLTVSNLKTSLGKWHNLKIGKVDYKRTSQLISIKNLSVNPVSADIPGTRVAIRAPQIDFTRFDISKAWEKNHFGFDKIQFVQPEIDVHLKKKPDGVPFRFSQTTDLYPYIEQYVDELQIRRLALDEAQLRLSGWKEKAWERKFNIRLDEVRMAENVPANSLFNAQEFEFSTTGLFSRDKKNRYEFYADSLVYHASKQRIRLIKAGIKPLYTPDEFFRLTGYQTDYINGSISFIDLEGIDEDQWLKDNLLNASLLRAGNGSMQIYRNKRYPFNSNQRPSWPLELLSDIPQPFVIDSVTISPADIRYSELTPISDTAGYVDFNRFTLNTGRISNTRISGSGSVNPLRMEASADLYGKAPVTIVSVFYPDSAGMHHNLTGKIGPAELTLINPMLKRSTPVIVESGTLHQLDFSLSVTESTATGELSMDYDNLSVAVMEYTDEGTKKSKLASFMTNKILLNSKNPKGNTLVPEKIIYSRDPSRSLLNYWWKALFSGVKQTLGIKKEEKTPE